MAGAGRAESSEHHPDGAHRDGRRNARREDALLQPELLGQPARGGTARLAAPRSAPHCQSARSPKREPSALALECRLRYGDQLPNCSLRLCPAERRSYRRERHRRKNICAAAAQRQRGAAKKDPHIQRLLPQKRRPADPQCRRQRRYAGRRNAGGGRIHGAACRNGQHAAVRAVPSCRRKGGLADRPAKSGKKPGR